MFCSGLFALPSPVWTICHGYVAIWIQYCLGSPERIRMYFNSGLFVAHNAAVLTVSLEILSGTSRGGSPLLDWQFSQMDKSDNISSCSPPLSTFALKHLLLLKVFGEFYDIISFIHLSKDQLLQFIKKIWDFGLKNPRRKFSPSPASPSPLIGGSLDNNVALRLWRQVVRRRSENWWRGL